MWTCPWHGWTCPRRPLPTSVGAGLHSLCPQSWKAPRALIPLIVASSRAAGRCLLCPFTEGGRGRYASSSGADVPTDTPCEPVPGLRSCRGLGVLCGPALGQRCGRRGPGGASPRKAGPPVLALPTQQSCGSGAPLPQRPGLGKDKGPGQMRQIPTSCLSTRAPRAAGMWGGRRLPRARSDPRILRRAPLDHLWGEAQMMWFAHPESATKCDFAPVGTDGSHHLG